MADQSRGVPETLRDQDPHSPAETFFDPTSSLRAMPLASWQRRLAVVLIMLVALGLATIPQRAAQAQDTPDDVVESVVEALERIGNPRHNNVVIAHNQKDDRSLLRASIELVRIPGETASPINVAFAYGDCTGCQTIAVALQIVFRSNAATVVAPENLAVAVNFVCTQCYTVAWAIQFVIPVDDPLQADRDERHAQRLFARMEKELRDVGKKRDFEVTEAEARIDAVLAEFRAQGAQLIEQRQEARN
jgi:hypothetical protein